MVQARYSFGYERTPVHIISANPGCSYYGVVLPCIFNLIGMCGFSILNSILGGQTLAAVSNDNLSWTIGIVIIVIISLLVHRTFTIHIRIELNNLHRSRSAVTKS